MCLTADCAQIEKWQALPADAPEPAQFEQWTRHLESCLCCQARLECAELDSDPLLRLAREVGDPTLAPADPTESRFLERLQEARSPLTADAAEPIDLSFLQPANQPGLLGMLDQYQVREVIGQGGMG